MIIRDEMAGTFSALLEGISIISEVMGEDQLAINDAHEGVVEFECSEVDIPKDSDDGIRLQELGFVVSYNDAWSWYINE